VSYRELKLARARAYALELGRDATVDSVYVAGSLTAGLGSSTSDIDLFTITSGSPGTPIRQVPADGDRLDVEAYPLSWYESVLSRLGGWSISRTDLRSKALAPAELDVLLRLRQSEIVKDSPRFEALRLLLGQHEDKLRQMTLAMWALEVNGHLSDFRGSVQDEDYDSAVIIGQSLLVCAGKAVAAAAGDLYYGRKWVQCQLRRSVGPAFPRERFSSLQRGEWMQGDPIGGAAELLSFAQTLAVASQVLGWGDAGVTAWPFWRQGQGHYRRQADFNPIHLTEGVLLNDEMRRQFVVPPQVALIWGLCNGRDEEEIADAALDLESRLERQDGPPMTGRRVRRILTALQARDLLQ
jgi:hypothetical protein